MRVRKKKHCEERIAACGDLICNDPLSFKGKWREYFSDKLGRDLSGSRLEIEIGCGKGAFIVETAKRSPDTLFCAVEKVRDVIMLAMEKALAAQVKNVVFLNANASFITEYFDTCEADRIYLNFSDPWPKERCAKRRLTSAGFLEDYRKVLKKDGGIFFKTDNRGLFDYSVESFKASGWRLENITYDLHSSAFAADNVMTEYEKNFSSKGMPIHRLEAYLDSEIK